MSNANKIVPHIMPPNDMSIARNTKRFLAVIVALLSLGWMPIVAMRAMSFLYSLLNMMRFACIFVMWANFKPPLFTGVLLCGRNTIECSSGIFAL